MILLSLKLFLALLSIPILVALGGAVFLYRCGAPPKEILSWFWRSTLFYLADLPVTLLGVVVIPLALPWRVIHPETAIPYSQYPQYGHWVMVNTPAWARLWDNVSDGLIGDQRGWFANHCHDKVGWIEKVFGTRFYAAWCMFVWAAIRNPAGYWSRIVSGVDVSRCRIEMLAGSSPDADKAHPGWHFLMATRDDGRTFHLFQVAMKYPFSQRHGFYCRFGWKVEMNEPVAPTEPLAERMRASCYKFSPWKDLGVLG